MTTVKDRSYYRQECGNDHDPDRDMYVFYILTLFSLIEYVYLAFVATSPMIVIEVFILLRTCRLISDEFSIFLLSSNVL